MFRMDAQYSMGGGIVCPTTAGQVVPFAKRLGLDEGLHMRFGKG